MLPSIRSCINDLDRNAADILHSFRKSDSEKAHSLGEHIRNDLDKHQSETLHIRIFFLENTCLVIVLIELLRQVIGLVCNQGWRIFSTRLTYFRRIKVQHLDKTYLLG